MLAASLDNAIADLMDTIRWSDHLSNNQPRPKAEVLGRPPKGDYSPIPPVPAWPWPWPRPACSSAWSCSRQCRLPRVGHPRGLVGPPRRRVASLGPVELLQWFLGLVDSDWTVVVLTDRALFARWLFPAIVSCAVFRRRRFRTGFRSCPRAPSFTRPFVVSLPSCSSLLRASACRSPRSPRLVSLSPCFLVFLCFSSSSFSSSPIYTSRLREVAPVGGVVVKQTRTFSQTLSNGL